MSARTSPGYSATPSTVTITVAPDHGGTATPSAPGAPAVQSITFTPSAAADTPNYTETFTYQISDGTTTFSSPMTVTVYNVVAGDDAVPGVTISTLGVAPDTATRRLQCRGIRRQQPGQLPSAVTATDGATGTTSIQRSTPITYTPDADFFAGTDTYTYTITDPADFSDTGTVTVTIPDETPTLADGSITTTAGVASPQVPLVITYGNGSQAQNPVTVSTQAANGSCARAGLGHHGTYTPNAGFSGGDSCVLTITDEDGGRAESDTGTFSVTVSGGGGGGGGGPQLPAGGSSSLDLWSLSLLAGVSWLRRRRDVRGNRE